MFSRFPGLSNMFSGPNLRNYSPQHHADQQRHHNNPNNMNPPRGSSNEGLIGRNDSPSHRSGARAQGGSHGGEKRSSSEIDNSQSVTSKISALYFEKSMNDMTLVVAGKDYLAHRLILCASSDVFQVMLMGGNWAEAQSTRVELQESAECAEHFEDFLKYLYTGKIILCLTNVLYLLTLADKYNVKDLVDLCLDYMIKHIPAAANCCKLIFWYQHLTLGGHKIVAEACKNFIKWNFEFVAKADDFCELDVELLVNILVDDDLVVYDEYSLFQCIASWVNSQSRKLSQDDPFLEDKMLQIVQDSMTCIRFPMMSPRQLADLLLSPITQKYKEYFMEKMAIGMAFHSDVAPQLMGLILEHPYRNKIFTPRHYCTDKWSVCLAVENFSSMSHYQSTTLVFSTPMSFAEKYCDKQVEWVVDLYPKGVCFNKFYLIVWQGTLECPEQVMRTVRLAVHCKNNDGDNEQNLIRVQIGILIAGVENDVEHVRHVIKKNYIFSGRDKILNFDDILPYHELVKSYNCEHTPVDHNYQNNNNNLPSTSSAGNHYTNNINNSSSSSVDTSSSSASPFSSTCSKDTCFLLCKDSLKIRIVITPMSEINI